MLRKILILDNIFLVLFLTSYGQNLVLNGSFEKFDQNRISENIPINWSIPTLNSTPDFYNSLTQKFFRTKRANAEKISAQDGKIFLGMHLNYGNASEFIQTELSDELESGLTYCFKIYIRPSKNTKYFIDSFGVLFSNSPVKFQYSEVSDFDIQLANVSNRIIENTEKWTSFCGRYKAQGGEKFITIGNFTDDSQVEHKKTEFDFSKRKFNLDKNASAYYLFDNVSLRLYSDLDTTDCLCDIHLIQAHKIDTRNTTIAQNVKTASCTKLKLSHIYFEVNDSTLTTEALETLDNLVSIISKKSPAKSIHVVGFSDLTGVSAEWNLQLSQARARSVYYYMVKNGVEKNIISWEGKGSIIPIDKISTTDMRAADRKVDIEITF